MIDQSYSQYIDEESAVVKRLDGEGYENLYDDCV